MAFGRKKFSDEDNIKIWIDKRVEEAEDSKKLAYKRIFTKFNVKMKIGELSQRSKETNLANLNLLMRLCPSLDFEHLTAEDCDTIQEALYNKYSNKVTINMRKLALRKWLTCSSQDHLLEYIKIINSKGKKLHPEDMITSDERDALIDKSTNPRDKAIIALLYDSGCRIGELLSMRVKDVKFDENGARVTFPKGKTGERTIRVVFATSYLRLWLDNHEYKDDMDAPLFYSLKGEYINREKSFKEIGNPTNKKLTTLSDEGVRRRLKITGKNAGINRNIHPHLFRHTRASELANTLTEQQLKKHLGWTQSSNMAAIYVHMNDSDLDNAILKVSGIDVEETSTKLSSKVVKCPRCKDLNAPSTDYCTKCGMPLSQKAIEEMETDRLDKIEMKERLSLVERKIEIFNALEIFRKAGVLDEIPTAVEELMKGVASLDKEINSIADKKAKKNLTIRKDEP